MEGGSGGGSGIVVVVVVGSCDSVVAVWEVCGTGPVSGWREGRGGGEGGGGLTDKGRH